VGVTRSRGSKRCGRKKVWELEGGDVQDGRAQGGGVRCGGLRWGGVYYTCERRSVRGEVVWDERERDVGVC
jgi:hypothetical protein